jgi:hypothetical protein
MDARLRGSNTHPIEQLAIRRGTHGVLRPCAEDRLQPSTCALAESRLTWLVAVVAVVWLAWSTVARADGPRIEIDQAAALAGGVSMADAPGFPVTIDVSGAYVLTSDLVAPAHVETPIVVAPHAAEASIDLNGFEVRFEQE